MSLTDKKEFDVRTLLVSTTSGAVGATTSAAVRLPRPANSLSLVLNAAMSASDASDTLDVKVQTKLDGSNWVDVCAFTQVLGNGGTKSIVAKLCANTAEAMFTNGALSAGQIRHLLGDEWRVSYTIVDPGGTVASFTFSVTAIPM